MFLKFDSIRNIRDLGGYLTLDNKIIKPKLLLRSSSLNDLSDSDAAKLYDEYHLKTIVDFRTTKSFKKRQDRIDYQKINHHHEFVLHFLEDHPYEMSQTLRPFDFFMTVYRGLALEKQAHVAYRHFFDHLLNTKDGAFLYHCTSGKDRTGIATVLLMHVLGCSIQTIYYEHLQTNVLAKKEFDEFLKAHNNLSDLEYEYYECYYIAKKEFLDEYFRVINENFFSLENYVNNVIKITKEEKDILKKRYLQ